MTGSEARSKTSKTIENQLPLKGYSGEFTDSITGRKYRIEGMGDGRYRIHTPKRQPKQK